MFSVDEHALDSNLLPETVHIVRNESQTSDARVLTPHDVIARSNPHSFTTLEDLRCTGYILPPPLPSALYRTTQSNISSLGRRTRTPCKAGYKFIGYSYIGYSHSTSERAVVAGGDGIDP